MGIVVSHDTPPVWAVESQRIRDAVRSFQGDLRSDNFEPSHAALLIVNFFAMKIEQILQRMVIDFHNFTLSLSDNILKATISKGVFSSVNHSGLRYSKPEKFTLALKSSIRSYHQQEGVLHDREETLFTATYLVGSDRSNRSAGLLFFGVSAEGISTAHFVADFQEQHLVADIEWNVDGPQIPKPSMSRNQWDDKGWASESVAYVTTQFWLNDQKDLISEVRNKINSGEPITVLIYTSELSFHVLGALKGIFLAFRKTTKNFDHVILYTRFNDERSVDDWLSNEVITLIKSNVSHFRILPPIGDKRRVTGYPGVCFSDAFMLGVAIHEALNRTC